MTFTSLFVYRLNAPIVERSAIGQFHAEFVLPKKAIEEFKRIYKKSYGIELSDEEATLKANNLVRLYQAVYGDPAFGRVELKKNSAGYEAK